MKAGEYTSFRYRIPGSDFWYGYFRLLQGCTARHGCRSLISAFLLAERKGGVTNAYIVKKKKGLIVWNVTVVRNAMKSILWRMSRSGVRHQDLISARNAEGSSAISAQNLAGYRIVMIWINPSSAFLKKSCPVDYHGSMCSTTILRVSYPGSYDVKAPRAVLSRGNGIFGNTLCPVN